MSVAEMVAPTMDQGEKRQLTCRSAVSEVEMFVRWIERRHKQQASAGTVFLDAYLTEAFRDEFGRARNRTVSYLGNIRRIDGTFPLIERELFLTRAERILATITELTEDDLTAARRALHRTVAPLTAAEAARAFIANIQWYRRWTAQQGIELNEAALLQLVLCSHDHDEVDRL